MELLAVWGEFLGGIGVVISLVFLGMQTPNSESLSVSRLAARTKTHLARYDVLYGRA